MGEHQTEITGPDLSAGVAISDIADGASIIGHVDETQVLLARKGEEFFAIGATCTHYSGPLGDGLIVGDTVRCPWHHACFSLRTGEAVRAPALNPVPCYRVERRGDSVYVGEIVTPKERSERRDQDAAASDQTPPEAVVIVGAGAAGDAAAEMLRREGFSGSITMIGADASAPYDRPNISKDYLAGTAPEEWLPLRSSTFYESNNIDLKLGTRVAFWDPDSRQIKISGGEAIGYDRLLLATGATPVRLPIPGAERPHVRYLRSLADCRQILAREKAQKAVVIGASFIGMEVAASLCVRGLEVQVVAPEATPFERVFGADLGIMIQGIHEERGVVFYLDSAVASIEEEKVVLADGNVLDADLVVIGAGVQPSVALAEQAGLDIDDGILVDQYLETSRKHVFAAGDVAKWPDPRLDRNIRIEHWVVAQRQGQVAARNMLGRREAFTAIPFFWTQHFEIPIAYVGHADSWDRMDVAGSIEDKDCAVAFRSEGKTLAVATVHRDETSLRAEAALERGDEDALRRLIPA